MKPLSRPELLRIFKFSFTASTFDESIGRSVVEPLILSTRLPAHSLNSS
jgi:hypothetical protein